jgi:autophagy-related protein 101
MEQQPPQEFILEAFADPSSVRDVVRAILHTIFFHRFFPGVTPRSREVLDIALPYIEDQEVDTMIEKRAAELDRELQIASSSSHPHSGGGGGRGHISVLFMEKKRRKTWYMRAAGDEEVCWERWTVKVTVAEPRTESGASFLVWYIWHGVGCWGLLTNV